jgi:hypothetical protein
LNVKHGLYGTPEYDAYYSAKHRCNNPNNESFPRYGGRGIKFMFDSFEQWYEELGHRPTPQHSVDRIDNDSHYMIGNVKWSTKREQSLNQRKTAKMNRARKRNLKKAMAALPISSSGHRNIHKSANGWCVHFNVNGKQTHFGTRPTIAEAIALRDSVIAERQAA